MHRQKSLEAYFLQFCLDLANRHFIQIVEWQVCFLYTSEKLIFHYVFLLVLVKILMVYKFITYNDCKFKITGE